MSSLYRDRTNTAGAPHRGLPVRRVPEAKRCQGGVVGLVDAVDSARGYAEVAQAAVREAVYPPMNRQRLTSSPRLLDDRGLTHVSRLLDDVQLAEPIDTYRKVVDGGKKRVVLFGDVLYVPQPVIDQPESIAIERRAHAAASIVAA